MTPRALHAPARVAGQPILRTQTDERLVDLVRVGHEPAFEAIVGRYRNGLMRYCTQIVTAGRADDVVQQTFVKAYDAIKRSDAELKLGPWLYRIAHNTALNALRDRGLRHEELSEELDGVERPDQALERREDLRAAFAAVQSLPQRQRDALLLRELEGRSYHEIATALGVTGGAVRQLLSRARATIRAGATAVMPVGVLVRFPFSTAPEALGGRAAEASAGAGASAVAVKLCATVLVTGAAAGGVVATNQARGGEPTPAAPGTAAVKGDGRNAADLNARHGTGGQADHNLERPPALAGHALGRSGPTRVDGQRRRGALGSRLDRLGGTEHAGEEHQSGSRGHLEQSGSGGRPPSDGHGSGDSRSGQPGSGDSGSGGPGLGDSGHSRSGDSGSGQPSSGSGQLPSDLPTPGSGDSGKSGPGPDSGHSGKDS